MIIFQSKASKEKRNTILSFVKSLTYHKKCLLISEKHMCVSHKSISWNSYNFKRTWLSFKVKHLQRKGRVFSLLTNFDISYTTAYFCREKHVHFSLEHFMKFLCFQKNTIIFQSKASTEKRNSVLCFGKSLTYHK